MSATKNEILQIKEIIIEELKMQREEFCRPHEEKIIEMEKQMVQIFCNGLVSTVKETKIAVEKLKSQRWAIPLSIIVSILATYFIDKLF